MRTNTETHNQAICKVRDLGALIPKRNVSIKSLTLGIRELCRKEGIQQKMCEESEGMEDAVASRRWSTPNELSDLLGASLSHNAKSEHLLTLQVFMYILWLLFF